MLRHSIFISVRSITIFKVTEGKVQSVDSHDTRSIILSSTSMNSVVVSSVLYHANSTLISYVLMFRLCGVITMPNCSCIGSCPSNTLILCCFNRSFVLRRPQIVFPKLASGCSLRLMMTLSIGCQLLHSMFVELHHSQSLLQLMNSHGSPHAKTSLASLK